MRRDEVMNYVRAKLKDFGVKDHLRRVKVMPANVVLSVVIGDKLWTRHLRSGIPPWELDAILADLRTAIILNEGGQKDISEWTGTQKIPTATP